MGTCSTTHISDEDGNHLVSIYRQFDGYFTGHGQELADFLKSKLLVKGYSDAESTNQAVGMGCLAALLICLLKKNRIGNVYITDKDNRGDYNYFVTYAGGKEQGMQVNIRVESYGKVVYDGTAKGFDGKELEAEELKTLGDVTD
jgi:hypothetical protein